MRWLWILGIAVSLKATSHIHFFNLWVERQADRLLVRASPESLMPYKVLRDENYTIRENIYDLTLDAPFRQTAFLMRTLERNRGSIYDGSGFLGVISFRFQLTVLDLTGRTLDQVQYKVVVGIAPEPDHGWITSDRTTQPHTFRISRLDEPEHYLDFLQNVVFPFGEKAMALPSGEAYLVDLYFQWPRVEVPERRFQVFDLFPSLLLWDKGLIRKIRLHLGTTYAFRDGGSWRQVNSEHLRIYKRSLETYHRALQLELGGHALLIPHLEEYVTTVPDDKKALKRLMESYVAADRDAEAFDLITRFQPFFAVIRDGLTTKDQLAEDATRRRNHLLGMRGAFTQDPNIRLAITSPMADDLVSGNTKLAFALSGQDSPLLLIECFLEDQLIAQLKEPPFEATFTVDGLSGDLELRVVAYFENKTYREENIKVRTLRVDEEAQVHLVALRASIFSKSPRKRPLTKDDFVLRENSKNKEIAHFRKETAPLRVVILLDTSISMFGDKLYRTQYAIKTFLSKLGAEDRASIYSFDHKVLKLCDFTNDFEGAAPPLMTLSPQWATSLYDAILIAHDALLGQNGTKIMVVISDGDDTFSTTTEHHVARLVKQSPVMVYSVILPGDFLGESIEHGSHFLREMARLSGSTSTKLGSVRHLSRTFDRIYNEFKSYYYLDYYSRIPDREKRRVHLRLRRSQARVRLRELN